MAEMAAAGIKWLALNVGDGLHWSDWQTVIDRARVANVEVLPWARCYTLVDCHALLETADTFASKVILNIENEFETVLTPARVAALLPDYTLQSDGLDIAFSCVGWLYNDTDFKPLADYPMLLQLFPTDPGWDPDNLESLQADCVQHARDKGFTYVGITCQTYGVAKPEWYAYMNGGTRSLYTGDDVAAGNWAAWS